MKLRSQMLLAGALTLAVPLVGWQSVKQLYSALQQTRIDEQTLKVANMRLALSESQSLYHALAAGEPSKGNSDWYAQTSQYPIFIDGYNDDWQTLAEEGSRYTLAGTSLNDDLSLQVRTARKESWLYLFISVTDNQVVYHTPPLLRADAGEGELPDQRTRLVNGDAVELLISNAQKQWQHGLFRAIAPGTLQALTASDTTDNKGRLQPAGRSMPRWQGAWETSVNGYQLEVKLPLPPSGASIGIAVIDVDEGISQVNAQTNTPVDTESSLAQRAERWVGSMAPDKMRSLHKQQTVSDDKPDFADGGLLFHESPLARQALERWTTPGVRARLFDINGRQLADVNNLYARSVAEDEAVAAAQSSDGLWDAILLRVFAFFVAGDLPLLPESRNAPVALQLSEQKRAAVTDDAPKTSRYVTDENDRVLGTLAPIGAEPRRGYLLFEANEEHASAYAGSQLARLFSLLLLVSLLAGSGLLIFATVLSSRIRRLSREAQSAVAADGRVQGLPGSDARDEIGDLSRKLSSLLSRSAAYTQYLEALSSRLSHELRTPLSVVRTSIESLDTDTLDEQSRVLIDRASGGADQLGSIIKALVESTRLEQTVQLADMHRVDLQQWMHGSLARYEQIYPQHEFLIAPKDTPSMLINASPELLQQAFDKLVDNAVSFCSGGTIMLHCDVDRTTDDSRVLLGVANRGARIDEHSLQQIFEPMFSSRDLIAGHDLESPGLHLGLGLYIVRMIAEAHGGSVFARNTPSRVLIGFHLPLA